MRSSTRSSSRLRQHPDEIGAAIVGAGLALLFLRATYETWGYRDFWERLGLGEAFK